MSGNDAKGRGRNQSSRRRRRGKAKPVDLWKPVAPPPEPAAIEPVEDPTLLLRSLGDPPLPGQGALAERHLALVASRAAGLAEALAATVELPLADEPDAETSADDADPADET